MSKPYMGQSVARADEAISREPTIGAIVRIGSSNGEERARARNVVNER
jgi:hypothetical protein